MEFFKFKPTVYRTGSMEESRQLKIDIKELTKAFPSDEKYRLTDQLIRASRGVGACIAEGHGRFTYKDQAHFCIISRGSE